MSQPLIKVDDLTKKFPVGGGRFRKATDFIHAVDGVSFEIQPGESLGLVGEMKFQSEEGSVMTMGKSLTKKGIMDMDRIAVRQLGKKK